MSKKIIGSILLVVGVFIGFVLLYSGSIFPHMIGPIVFVSAGAFLLLYKGKQK